MTQPTKKPGLQTTAPQLACKLAECRKPWHLQLPANGSEPNQAHTKKSSTNPAKGQRNTVPPQPLWVVQPELLGVLPAGLYNYLPPNTGH